MHQSPRKHLLTWIRREVVCRISPYIPIHRLHGDLKRRHQRNFIPNKNAETWFKGRRCVQSRDKKWLPWPSTFNSWVIADVHIVIVLQLRHYVIATLVYIILSIKLKTCFLFIDIIRTYVYIIILTFFLLLSFIKS